jgi:uncharacterized protein (DUF2147 family)
MSLQMTNPKVVNIVFKLISATCFLFVLLLTLSLSNDKADKILGVYWAPDKDVRISIYKKNGKFFGKSVFSKTPLLKDVHNPNPDLRNRIILGIDVFYDFTFDESTREYINGKIYNPQDGKTYSALMWMDGDNMILKGYIGFPIFGITKTFERYE